MKTDPVMDTSAAVIIALLDLRPHPEGGYFRETFRDPAQDSRGRAVSTLIYFLLEAGQLSRWHRVDAAEVWHFYAGAPLEIKSQHTGRERRACIGFGPRSLHRGGAPADSVVPRHCWQRAASLGTWAWLAAVSRRASNSQASNWRRQIGRPWQRRREPGEGAQSRWPSRLGS